MLVIAASTAHAEDRTSYIARALDSVRALGGKRAQLETDLYQACRQAEACTDAIVDDRCHHDAACMAAADIVVTNLRAATSWVDQNTRAQLVRSSTDYHAALLVELRKRYAALAAELVIEASTSTPRLAESIDRLCATRDREVHACRPGDAACVPSIPWTRCVAALVWYVGDNP
ncbi:MAG TPA: hypothetical protein VFQ65_31310 [Kofleriaceae bacterium]|nr:hypothetical protein [Kofleriaceae bacterium]